MVGGGGGGVGVDHCIRTEEPIIIQQMNFFLHLHLNGKKNCNEPRCWQCFYLHDLTVKLDMVLLFLTIQTDLYCD